MSLAEKIKYLASYYGIAAVFLLIAAAAALFFLSDFRRERAEDAFYVLAVGVEAPGDGVSRMQRELEAALGLDSDKQECVLEFGYAAMDTQSEAVVSAYMQSGRVDLVLASEEEFNRYAAAGYFLPLEGSGLVALEEFGEGDRFYAELIDYSQGGAVTEIPFHPHEAGADSQCYGIYLRGGELDGNVIGVMANCPHEDLAASGLQYFLGA